jgi:hypothetical protein
MKVLPGSGGSRGRGGQAQAQTIHSLLTIVLLIRHLRQAFPTITNTFSLAGWSRPGRPPASRPAAIRGTTRNGAERGRPAAIATSWPDNPPWRDHFHDTAVRLIFAISSKHGCAPATAWTRGIGLRMRLARRNAAPAPDIRRPANPACVANEIKSVTQTY